jgi:Rieske Fe-S protein
VGDGCGRSRDSERVAVEPAAAAPIRPESSGHRDGGAAEGVVAYTSICTHTGCDVDEWRQDEQQLECACHFSIFDPRDGGKVVDGPAPRVLPALPLKIVDGRLAVAGPFVTPVGFEKG